MSQYRTGRVVVLNDYEYVFSSPDADWSSIEPGNLFSVTGTRELYTIANALEANGYTLWVNSTEYTVGAMVEYNGLYYAVHSAPPAGTLPTNTTYYAEVGLWLLVLDRPYIGDTGVLVTYSISTDFTPNFSFPQILPGDVSTGLLVNRAFTKLDTLLLPLGSSEITSATFKDDFISNPSSTQKGELGWTPSSDSGTILYADGGEEHPGCLDLPAPSAGGTRTLALYPEGVSTFNNVGNREFDMTWIFKGNRTSSSSLIFAGLTNASSGTYAPPSNEVGILGKILTYPNYQFVVRRANVLYVLDSGVPFTNGAWVRFRARRVKGANRIAFSINGGAEKVQTILPDTAFHNPMAVAQKSGATGTVSILLDFFSLGVYDLVR